MQAVLLERFISKRGGQEEYWGAGLGDASGDGDVDEEGAGLGHLGPGLRTLQPASTFGQSHFGPNHREDLGRTESRSPCPVTAALRPEPTSARANPGQSQRSQVEGGGGEESPALLPARPERRVAAAGDGGELRELSGDEHAQQAPRDRRVRHGPRDLLEAGGGVEAPPRGPRAVVSFGPVVKNLPSGWDVLWKSRDDPVHAEQLVGREA